jgi:hypothetical protein
MSTVRAIPTGEKTLMSVPISTFSGTEEKKKKFREKWRIVRMIQP